MKEIIKTINTSQLSSQKVVFKWIIEDKVK